jgi:SAM-dependent methyltransferase
MSPKIPVPSLDPRRYAETFAVFMERSLEYPQIIEELVRMTGEHLRDSFHMLDIGAGTGLVIRGFCSCSSIRPGRYLAFEPNPRHAGPLAATLAELGIEHEIRARPFTLETMLPREFDLVLFSHSLYWMPDPARYMLHAASALSTPGLALAFLGGPYGIYSMIRLFEPLLERTTPMLANHTLSSHELVRDLRALGVEPEVRMLSTPLDLTGLFEPEAASELEELLSFCMQIEFTRLPHWLQADMIQYLRGACVSQEGRLHWYIPNAAVWFTQ